MSAGVSDQRMKGQGNQVSNGSKEQLGAGEGATGSEEFEPWRSQQQQQQQQSSAAHTAAYGTNAPISSGTDLYNMSTAVSGYYGSGGSYPYQAYGVGDGTWSNGTDPMPFLSGYPHDSYSMDGMFGPSTTFSTPTAAFTGQPSSFNYFTHSNGDYNTWGNQLSSQRKDDYYYRDPSQNMYATMPDNSLKGVEHAMQSLDLKSVESKELGSQKKTMSWASIASQPAKPQVPLSSTGLKKKGPGMPPGPIVPGKHNMDIGTWDTNKSTPPQIPPPVVTNVVPPKNTLPPNVTQTPPASNVRMGWSAAPPPQPQVPRQPQNVTQAPPPRGPQHPMPPAAAYQPQPMMPPMMPAQVPAGSHIQGMMPPPPMQMMMPQATNTGAHSAAQTAPAPQHPVLDELMSKHKYNPTDFDLTAPNARFFVIKSYSEDDIHRSIKYEIWCSTEHGNKRLDGAFQERQEKQGYIYLFFSVNGSGHFCGMAQMLSQVDYSSSSSVWSQDKWKGQFKVRWIYVKDVPNVQLRHIRLENNDNKPVTNSRDAQEVPHARGLQVLRIMHSYRHSTSIFDDFIHYEKRQEEEDTRKVPPAKEPHQHQDGPNIRDNSHGGGPGRDYHNREHRGGPRDRNYDRDHRDDRGDPRDQRDNHRNDRHERNEGHRGGYRNDRNERGDRNNDRQDRGGDRNDRGEHQRGDRNDYGPREHRDYHKQDRDHREHREHRGGGRGGRGGGGGHHHNNRN